MKMMLEQVIRLQQMRNCCERAQRNPQLTNGEKATARARKQHERERLPNQVLAEYDRLKKTERTLLTCPEVFAMAVLVAAYRSLSPLQRRRLVRHFESPDPQTKQFRPVERKKQSKHRAPFQNG